MPCDSHDETQFLSARLFSEYRSSRFGKLITNCAECRVAKFVCNIYWTDLDPTRKCRDCALNDLYASGFTGCRACHACCDPCIDEISNRLVRDIFVKKRNATSKRARPE